LGFFRISKTMAKKQTTSDYQKITKKSIGRHKKKLNKDEKRSFKKYNSQGK